MNTFWCSVQWLEKEGLAYVDHGIAFASMSILVFPEILALISTRFLMLLPAIYMGEKLVWETLLASRVCLS